MKIRLSAPTLRETLLSILKGENNELEAHKVMIHEFSTFDRFSSGAELPTDFVDSVPVSDVEAKGGGSRKYSIDPDLELCVKILLKVVGAVKKNTQMSFTSSLKREQDSLPQIKLRFRFQIFSDCSEDIFSLPALPNLAESECGSCKEEVDSL